MLARRSPPHPSKGGSADEHPIAALVLAAGLSARMATPKPLQSLGGKPLLAHVLDALRGSGVWETIVVLGAEADRIRREIPLLGERPIFHPDFREGMSSSIRAGMLAASPGADAFLIVLGDQPLVMASTIRALAARHGSAATKILVPTYRGVRGNPVLLPRSLAAEIASIRGDVGCREVVRRHPEATEEVPVDDPGVLLDVDTPEDLRRIQEALDHRVPLETLVADRLRSAVRSPSTS